MKLKDTPYYKQLVIAAKQKEIEDNKEAFKDTNDFKELKIDSVELSKSTLGAIEADVLIQFGEHKKRIIDFESALGKIKTDYNKSLTSLPLNYDEIKRHIMNEKVAEANIKIAKEVNKIVFGLEGDDTLEA